MFHWLVLHPCSLESFQNKHKPFSWALLLRGLSLKQELRSADIKELVLRSHKAQNQGLNLDAFDLFFSIVLDIHNE